MWTKRECSSAQKELTIPRLRAMVWHCRNIWPYILHVALLHSADDWSYASVEVLSLHSPPLAITEISLAIAGCFATLDHASIAGVADTRRQDDQIHRREVLACIVHEHNARWRVDRTYEYLAIVDFTSKASPWTSPKFPWLFLLLVHDLKHKDKKISES